MLEAPRRINVHFVPSVRLPSGLGEPPVPPAIAALAAALYSATGRRWRRQPFDIQGPDRQTEIVQILRVADPLPLAAVSGPAGAETLRDGLLPALRDLDTTVQESAVSLGVASGNPVRDAFDVAARLAHRVRESREDHRLVIVLASACLSALGSCAGMRSKEGGVVWLDAHADFNTPETTSSGLLDGMALATLTGRCWHALTARIPGFRPVPEASVDLVGARDLDDAEAALLEGSAIRRWAVEAAGDFAESVFRQEMEETYVHLDLDVLDPSVGRANRLAVPGGLSGDALEALFASLGRHAPVGILGLTAYDPAEDETGGAAAAAVRAVRALVAARLERSW